MAQDTRALEDILDPRFNRDMTIHQRMHLGMTLADYVQKEKKDKMRYSIVSHDAVTAIIRDVCLKTGVHYYPLDGSEKWQVNGNRFELKLAVRFQSIDNPEDFIDVLGFGFGIDEGDKGPGKALSYAVKYALLKAYGLETGDDPDYDQDVQHRSSTAQRAQEFEKNILTTTDAASLGLLLTAPETDVLMASLQAQEPGEYRRIRSVVAKQAKQIGLDLSKLDQ